jgi:DNA invertase Pin-like site-specific DNA recombinase
MNPKITEHHRCKPAYIYLRQSTPGQVRHHQESTERQYALREKALELGWSESLIRTLDRDLGRSGTEMTAREDFKTLVADVSMSQVGAVFALEVSRLARSNLDWHRLLELCVHEQSLLKCIRQNVAYRQKVASALSQIHCGHTAAKLIESW